MSCKPTIKANSTLGSMLGLTEDKRYESIEAIKQDIKGFKEFVNSNSINTENTVIEPSITNDISMEEEMERIAKENGFSTNVDENRLKDNKKNRTKKVYSGYDKTNIKQDEKWFKARFPNVDFNIVSKLIDGNAFGQFRNAAVYVYKNAEVGTTYHEAFHVVTELFMTSDEKQALINEWKANNPSRKDLTDAKIEEELAEDFRDFVLNGTIKYPKVKQGLFSRLKSFIKGLFISNPKGISEVFERIENGYYANKEFNRPSQNISQKKNRVKIEGFTSGDINAIVDGINVTFFNAIFNSPKDISRFVAGKVTKKETNKAYHKAKEEIFEGFKAEMAKSKNMSLTEKDRLDAKRNAMVLVKASQNENFIQFIDLHKDILKQYHIDAKYNAEDMISEIEITSNDKENQWAEVAINTSAKDNASNAIRLLVASLKNYNPDGSNVYNHLNLQSSIGFSKAFAILSNKLSNTSNITEKITILKSIGIREKYMLDLIEMLSLENIDNLDIEGMNLIMQFNQAFSKHKGLYYNQVFNKDGKLETFDANRGSQRKRITQNWDALLKTSLMINSTPEGFRYNKEAIKKISLPNKTKIKDKVDAFNKIKELHKWLNAVGIAIPIEYLEQELNTSNLLQTAIINAHYINNDLIKDNKSIFESNFNSSNRVNFFVDIYGKYNLDSIDNQFIGASGKRIYANSLFHNLAQTIVGISSSKSLSELYSKMPNLKDVYSSSSLLLERLFSPENGKRIAKQLFQIKTFNGLSIEKGGKTLENDQIKNLDRFIQVFRGTMNGEVHMHRTADNKLERTINIGKLLFNEEAVANNDHIEAFKNYIVDEVLSLSSFKKRKDEFQFENILPFTESITAYNEKGSELYTLLIQASELETEEDIIAEVHSILGTTFGEEAVSFTDIIESGISKLNNDVLDFAKSENMITDSGESFTGKNLSGLELENHINAYVVNNIANNIELNKLITGNPIIYKNADNFYKRMSAVVGTKKSIADDAVVNSWINKNLKRSDKKKTNEVAKMKVATFNDPIAEAALKDMLGPGYVGHEEADAQGWITLDEYREMLFRTGDWSKPALEELYQWEVQFEKLAKQSIIDGGKVSAELKAHLKTKPKDIAFNPLKPQHMAPLAEEGFVQGMYKLSAFPLSPSTIYKIENGIVVARNMVAFNEMLRENQIGLAVVASANKVGIPKTKGEVQQLYDNKGSLTTLNKDNIRTVDTYYRNWGIQLDMGFKQKDKVTSGTQQSKHIMSGMASGGEFKPMRFVNRVYDKATNSFKETLSKASSATTERVYRENVTLNNERVSRGQKSILRSLGFELSDDGNYYNSQFVNSDMLKKTLIDEAISRDQPDNIIDAIRDINTEDFAIEKFLNSEKIYNIIMSIADSRTLKKKRKGAPKVQVSEAMFESGDRRISIQNNKTKEIVASNMEYKELSPTKKLLANDKNHTVLVSSNKLKFYEKSENGTTGMQVLLPSIYKGVFEIGKLDKRLLEAIGFRIPTQGMSSIDFIEIAGFLPENAGDSVVVPSEYVAKTGSDFDIDKLYMHLANYYDNNGKIEYAEYLHGNTDEDLKRQAIVLLNEEINHVETLLNDNTLGKDFKQSVKDIKKFSEDINKLNNFDNEKSDLAKIQLSMAKSSFDLIVKDVVEVLKGLPIEQRNTSKAIENRMNEVARMILSSPENFKQLVAPIDDPVLKDLSNEINPIKKEKSFTTLIHPLSLIDLSEQFFESKSGVATSAIHSTNHILATIDGYFVAPTIKTSFSKNLKEKIGLNQNDTKFDTKIVLNHNVNENGYVDLSQEKDASNDKSIAQLLSYTMNAFVDAAKDPFILRLNITTLTSNTFMYLMRAGVPIKELAYFMSQPIIRDYINMTGSLESQHANAKKEDKDQDTIKLNILNKYNNNHKGSDNISFSNLETTIKSKRKVAIKMNDRQRKFQQDVFIEFIKYMEVAKQLSSQMATNTYDTKGMTKNLNTLILKLDKTNSVGTNVIANAHKTTSSEGFLGKYKSVAENFVDAFGKISILGKNEFINNNFNKFKDQISELKLGLDDKADLMSNFIKDTMSLLPIGISYSMDKNGMKTEMPISNEIDGLMKGDNSVPKVAIKLKDSMSGNALLNSIIPIIREDGNIDSIYFNPVGTDKQSQDDITEGWEELFQINEDFASRLAKFAIAQSGLDNSPISFTKFMPQAIWNTIIETSLNNLDKKSADGIYDAVFYNKKNFRNSNIIADNKLSALAKGLDYFYSKDLNKLYKRTVSITTGKRSSNDKFTEIPFTGEYNMSIYASYMNTIDVKSNSEIENNPEERETVIIPDKVEANNEFINEGSDINELVGYTKEIESEGISIDEWANLSEEEKENIKKCK